jgi:hypothetical protein
MLFHRVLPAAALFGAASLSVSALAQNVPQPPPAGVKAGPRKLVPQVDEPVQVQPQQAPQQEALPQLPENPIRLEEDRKPVEGPVNALPQPPVNTPAAGTPHVGLPAPTRTAVKPKGPVYYYPQDPYAFPANVTTPPAMHIPNSPFVEDLSGDGDHGRYTYYSYRRPWYTPGHLSANVTIVW